MPATIPQPVLDWKIPPRYTLKTMIGAGAYGHVCEAKDHQTGRSVAIKKIHRVFEDLVDCKRILREIAILNKLQHPNIVRMVDICVPDDLGHFDELYLVLEIADSDFRKLFRTAVYLQDIHVRTLLYNLLVGTRYVHSAGIYHRDLKPANCLVNQDCSVKICDFGLARTVNAPEDNVLQANDGNNKSDKPVNMKRQLTTHVVTRWYRAPELILLQDNYTEAIDVWSLGCIFAELLGMMKENVPQYECRSQLFPGTSCFPLSPDQKRTAETRLKSTSRSDQLNMIFNVIGTPSPEDIQFLEKEDAKKYIQIFVPREPVELRTKFRGANDDALELIRRMLKFNPAKRITIDEALNSPLFQEIRDPERETLATERVELPFDDWKPMTENQLRYAFLMEVKRFHPEVEIPEVLEAAGYKC